MVQTIVRTSSGFTPKAQRLLEAAFRAHRRHGGTMGMNFVECSKCRFHVHMEHDYLVRHWAAGSPYEKITSQRSPRMK